MKKLISVTVLVFLSLFTTGCAAGRIQEKSYLRAASVRTGSVTELTLAFFDEEDTVTAEGADISAAIKEAELKKGRSIFTGYTELIIEDGQNSRELLEDMLNVRKVSPSCRVVYCENGRQLLEERDAEQLIGTADQAAKQGIAPESGIITVLGELCARGTAEVAGLSTDGAAGRHIIF